jgi:hypothetical protein
MTAQLPAYTEEENTTMGPVTFVLIGGKLVTSVSTRTQPVFNPATGEQASAVDLASAAEVSAAIAVAKAAFPAWRATNLSRRAEVMFHMRELISANRKMHKMYRRHKLLRVVCVSASGQMRIWPRSLSRSRPILICSS